MRRKIFISTLLGSLLTFFSPAPADARVDVGVSVSAFYDGLSPYGEWVTVGTYGECWRPRGVVAGWQPYWNGRWCYTEYGWTWVSFDPWGGDPYHYGTWVVTADWGWVWIPGTIWAPAWVTWCDADGYIGWAPVPPSISIGLVGYSGPAIVAPARSYVFVPTRSFVGGDVRTVRVDPARNGAFVSHAQKITNFSVSGGVVRTGGPPVSRIQKVTGAPVRTVGLGDAKTHAVPIARSGGDSRHLSVIAPRREQVAARHPVQNRGEQVTAPPRRAESSHEAKAPPPARRAEPPHAKKAEPMVERKGPPHEMKAQAPLRKPEPHPETKVEPAQRHKEPPHETKSPPAVRKKEPPHETTAQLAARTAEPPHHVNAQAPVRRPEPRPETKPEPAVRRKEPPHETRVQPAARKAEPPHQVKAQPVAKKPEKPEKPEKKGG